MALKLKQSGIQPLGQFDGYDADYLNIAGGEVGRWIAVPYVFPATATSDHAAYDVFDGYSGSPVHVRPAVTRMLTLLGGATTYRPLFLLDEGTIGYGTMFGTLVGGVVGQNVPNPGNLAGAVVFGPHTASGSGKVTLWDKPGLYASTLDAVDPTIVPATSNAQPGDPLYADVFGHLTLTEASGFDFTGPGTATIVGRFAEFTTNGSLVTTPNYMAMTPVVRQFTELLFHFRVEN